MYEISSFTVHKVTLHSIGIPHASDSRIILYYISPPSVNSVLAKLKTKTIYLSMCRFLRKTAQMRSQEPKIQEFAQSNDCPTHHTSIFQCTPLPDRDTLGSTHCDAGQRAQPLGLSERLLSRHTGPRPHGRCPARGSGGLWAHPSRRVHRLWAPKSRRLRALTRD